MIRIEISVICFEVSVPYESHIVIFSLLNLGSWGMKKKRSHSSERGKSATSGSSNVPTPSTDKKYSGQSYTATTLGRRCSKRTRGFWQTKKGEIIAFTKSSPRSMDGPPPLPSPPCLRKKSKSDHPHIPHRKKRELRPAVDPNGQACGLPPSAFHCSGQGWPREPSPGLLLLLFVLLLLPLPASSSSSSCCCFSSFLCV